MRLPSLETLAHQAREVLFRFPWTLTAAVIAAAAALQGTARPANADELARIGMAVALGIPLTLALTLFAEERGWTPGRKAALNAGGVVLLLVFYLVWPGPERKHEVIRYLQLSAGLHLLVAVLPFLGRDESRAFWQYNRRLFLGILRAAVFSAVLFAGLAIAIVALDQLFGVHVPEEVYPRLWIVVVFVLNTWIFLAEVPRGMGRLASDTSYPRVLKVFAQYILTPLVFVYLAMLLAYLVKIILGGEWPSGWIGWLVTSVAVAGLLGFLLVHPLRNEPGEGWIRTYSRGLFIGLIPAAVVLLLAFWKRVLPYGWTELRLLGVLLGLWLLGIALSYTLRPRAGIRPIPLTLAALLLLTAYGPLSVTSLSVASQGRRLARLISQSDEANREREASAALRFLLEHGARRQVAAAFPSKLEPLNWDSLPDSPTLRDQAATRILKRAGLRYVPRFAMSDEGYVHLNAARHSATPISGLEWMLNVSAGDTTTLVAGGDSVRVRFDTATGIARVRAGSDTLVFDLGRLAAQVQDSAQSWSVAADRLRLEARSPTRRAVLALESINGRLQGDSIRVRGWQGRLFLGKAK
ncbi:MAG TPA: DUF4153 domain-containing protein [Gemmatimonadales bacterium]